jgi:hypothetical protein
MNSKPLTDAARVRVATFAVAGAALFLTGCSSVIVTAPVGDKPHVLNAADWDGTWTMDNDAATVRVTDAAAGKLEVLSVQTDEGRPKVRTYTVFIRESGETLFATLQSEDMPKDRYLWARVRRSGDYLMVWSPDAEKFERLVQSGQIKGAMKDGDVHLEALTPSEVSGLAAEKYGVVYEWQRPAVLQRLRRVSAP